ncbi:alpha/beta fold hydrolase [Geodermatophilus sp. SYSU D01186]
MRARRVAVLTGTAVGAATALRLWHARRAALQLTGDPAGVRTDDGVRLHVETDGPDDAPVTVVLVHGFAARSSMFDPQWAALRGCTRVVRFDQRGHGRSGWAGSLRATPRRLGRDLHRVVDTVAGPGPVVLVGHSMGGMAVLALAHERPEQFGSRIAGVALLSTAAAPPAAAGLEPGARARLRTVLGLGVAWLLWLAAPLIHEVQPFRSRPVQGLVRRRLFAGDPPEAAVRQTIRSWERTPTAVMAAHLLGLAGYGTGSRQQAAVEALRNVPVLVLAGTRDATIDPATAGRLTGRIGPSAGLVLVPGAGHMVTLSHAAAVNTALRGLLARVHRDPTGERRSS